MPRTFKWDQTGLDRIEALAEDVARKTVQSVAEDARRLAPVDTGKLRSSIDWVWHDNVGLVTVDVDYAYYVEFGTSRMRAQPFLRPALYRKRDGS